MAISVSLAQLDSAADSLALQKMQARIELENAQAYQDELAAVRAHREAEAAANAASRAESLRHNAALEAVFARNAATAEAHLALFRQQATGFDASERGEIMRKAFETLLPQVVKPSTATTEAGKRADAKADAEWLRIEVEEVLAVYDALRAPPG